MTKVSKLLNMTVLATVCTAQPASIRKCVR
jgi:hypothetical protein